jgi:orotate phosphoribosyltransferase
VLEDVVTTGQSALKAVERLQNAGYQVSQILSLVDRQQGGAELYQENGLSFAALFTIKDIQTHWATVNAE